MFGRNQCRKKQFEVEKAFLFQNKKKRWFPRHRVLLIACCLKLSWSRDLASSTNFSPLSRRRRDRAGDGIHPTSLGWRRPESKVDMCGPHSSECSPNSWGWEQDHGIRICCRGKARPDREEVSTEALSLRNRRNKAGCTRSKSVDCTGNFVQKCRVLHQSAIQKGG